MKEKLNNALNDIDGRFIEEAAHAGRRRKRAPVILAASIGTAAAAAAVAAVCVLAANKPDPGVDLIQPPVSSAADALTWEDSAAGSAETADSSAEVTGDTSEEGSSSIRFSPDQLDESIKAVCKEGSSYSAARAQELIRSSAMPLDDDSMLVTKENGYDKWTGEVHYGVDLSDGESSTVYAYQSGTVLRAADSGWNGGLGSYILIDHGSGLVTVYGCLGRVDVTEGQQVERGEVIGGSGSTGYSSGVHLHFEIRENGVISTAMGSFTGDSHTHKWVSEGTKVYSSVSGDVWLVGEVPDMGNIVVIHGDDGRFTMYSHCGEVLVLPGDEVSAGGRIAVAGKPYGSDMTVIAEEEIAEDMFTYYSAACVEGEFRQQEVDLIWPVGGEDGGVITELMYGYGGYCAHTGIDITAPKGTDVFAAESGTVIKACWYDGYGNCVIIDHGSGLVTLYGHLDEIGVAEGQEVLAGERIGSTGSTGNTTGYALHFEVRRNGEKVNPIPYLPWHEIDIS